MTMERKLFWISITLLCLVRTSKLVSHNSSSVGPPTSSSFDESDCKPQYTDICSDPFEVYPPLKIYPLRTCIDLSKSEILIYDWVNVICVWMSNCLTEIKHINESNVFRTISRHKEKPTCLPSIYDDDYSDRSNFYYLYYTFMSNKEILEQLDLVESFENLSHLYLESSHEYRSSSNNNDFQIIDCFYCQYEEFIQTQQSNLQSMYSEIWWVYIFQKYIEVIIAVIIMTLGLLMSGTLLFIFIKHRDMRTEPNMIIMTIAICDLLSLFILYPFQYGLFNGILRFSHWEELYVALLHVFYFVSAQCILALSLQRLLVIYGCLSSKCCLVIGKCFRIFLFILFVFSPPSFVLGYAFGPWKYSAVTGAFLIFILSAECYFIILLPITATIINVVTSRKLRRIAREMPGENNNDHQINSCFKSAKMINVLCFVIWITHTPIVALIFSFFYDRLDQLSALKMKYAYFTLQSLFGLNAFLNPLIQFLMSKKFRELYMRYLFHFWMKSFPCRSVGRIS